MRFVEVQPKKCTIGLIKIINILGIEKIGGFCAENAIWRMIEKHSMRQHAKTPSAKLKVEIQSLARQIVIKRDGGCVFRDLENFPPCNGYSAGGNLVLQADHMISRGKNIGFADTRLINCVCKGHHTAKTFDTTGRYEEALRGIVGEERALLWDRARADRKSYPRGAYEWGKEALALRQELKQLA